MRRALVGLLLAAVALGPSAAAAQSPAERISFMVFGDLAEKAAYEQLVAEGGSTSRISPARSWHARSTAGPASTR
jgi:hypothetical protein